ncbi:zinc finger protein 165-like isoform 1-T1 [Glossophaga mutica]
MHLGPAELCRLWLWPQMHNKEQMLELLVLEQFLRILAPGLYTRVRKWCPQSSEKAVTALEDSERGSEEVTLQVAVPECGREIFRRKGVPPGPALTARSSPGTHVVLQSPVVDRPAVRGTGTVTLPSQTVPAAVGGPLLVAQ